MSPEQLRSAKNVDVRTDIWALGVILYRLVSLRYPYDDFDGFASLVAAVMTEPPRPLASFVSGLPQGFEAAVMRCLERDPGARYLDVAEFAEAMAPYGSPSMATSVQRVASTLERRGQRQSRLPAAPAPPPSRDGLVSYGSPAAVPAVTAGTSTGATTQAEWNRTVGGTADTAGRSNKGMIVGGGVAVAIALGVVGVFAFGGAGATKEPSAQPAGIVSATPPSSTNSASAVASAVPASDPVASASASPESAGGNASKDVPTGTTRKPSTGTKSGAGDAPVDTKPKGATPTAPATETAAPIPAKKNDDNRKSW